VRRDSDVDIVVECQDCCYYDYMPGQKPTTPVSTPYGGEWTPTKLRSEVTMALNNSFGSSAIDSSGKVALVVAAVPGSRPGIDVVPSFDYFLYDDPQRKSYRRGSCVWPKTGSTKIVNWPDQQLDRPGDLGGSDPWRGWEPCQHSGSTPRSCASAR